MDIDAIITVSVIIIAMILFITEYVSVDIVALSIMVSLVLTGVITPEQGLHGFANEAVITVLAMFVLSAAIIKTNVIERIGPTITRFLKKGYTVSISGLALVVGGMSAFINNTPVVATFIPVISKAARKANMPSSRFLIPLSFVAIFGGTCTLIGTSTNLLVSGISSEHGLGEFSMFLLTPLGLIFMLVGTVYLLIFGKRLIPEREEFSEDIDDHQINNFLTEIQFQPVSFVQNLTIKEVFSLDNTTLDVLFIKRKSDLIERPSEDITLEDGDVLLVRGGLDKIKKIIQSDYLNIIDSMADKKFPEQETKLIELILQPTSDVLRKKIKNIDFQKKYQANVLAIRQRGETKFRNLGEVVLKSGDVLLIQTNERGYNAFLEYQKTSGSPFLILKETPIEKLNKKNLIIACLTIAGVIAAASTGAVSIAIAAITGIVFLNLTRVITMEDAYNAVDWQVIFLLAGALSLEKAMNESGVSDSIGYFMVDTIGSDFGPAVVVSALYLLTTIITGIISNNAAAALFAPIAISIAGSMEVSAVPFLVAIAFAGSASFYTPIGYQTNTMVYSAGNYKFRDFAIIGGPLNVIFWLIATALIPLLYPF